MNNRINILNIETINNNKFLVSVSGVYTASDNNEYVRSYKEQNNVENTLKKWFGNIERKR